MNEPTFKLTYIVRIRSIEFLFSPSFSSHPPIQLHELNAIRMIIVADFFIDFIAHYGIYLL